MYQDIYNCICQNTKQNLIYTIHYVTPTAQLLFKIDFQKVDQRQTPQGQSVAKPETPLQNIQVE